MIDKNSHTKSNYYIKDKGCFLRNPDYDRNQVDYKIAWGLVGGFLSFHSSFVY